MSARIRRLASIFKTSWGEIRKESWTRQESKNETVCVHKHQACILHWPLPTHPYTPPWCKPPWLCKELTYPRHTAPGFLLPSLCWSEPRYNSEVDSFSTQVKFTRQWKGVVDCCRKWPWLNPIFFFSGHHSFNADQFTALDHHTASQMLVPALGGDGTDVWARC